MTSESAKKTNRGLVIALCVVLVVGAVLAGYLMQQRSALQAQVNDLDAQLTESMNTWQRIAEEKEALEAALTETNNALRQAQVMMEESTARAQTLGAQVTELGEEATLLERLESYAGAMETLVANAQDAKTTTENRLSDSKSKLAQTRARLVQAQDMLVGSENALDAAEKENAELKASVEAAEAQLTQLISDLTAAKDAQREALQMLKMHYEQYLANLEAQTAAASEDMELQERVTALREQIAALEAQIAALE